MLAIHVGISELAVSPCPRGKEGKGSLAVATAARTVGRVFVAAMLIVCVLACGQRAAGDELPSPGRRANLWSLEPVRESGVPAVQQEDWPHGEIDRFVLARMEAAGLAPVADADRRALVRRAYFALVGLPPTPEEVEAFIADNEDDAFERLVDRLLASPHFGERWGRHWLDVARFAQSTGGGRSLLYGTAWRYRDYVIDSFNDDKPFARFIVEQLAGDLMPQASADEAREQLIATAFLALGPTNYELQDKEQLRMDVIDEQIDTTGRAFLGMTLGCARCHDHKFDPVPTKDYYALVGIFRSTKTLIHDNVSTWVKRPLPDEAVDSMNDQVAALAADLQQREADLADLRRELGLAGGALSLDDEDPSVEFSGAWSGSSNVTPFVGKEYRYSNSSDALAKYSFKLDEPGRYEVRVSYTPHANRTAAAAIEVEHQSGIDKVQLDQRQPPSFGSHEAVGTFDFAKGAVVTIRSSGAGGALVADAVKLVPVAEQEYPQLAKLEGQVEELKAAIEAKKKAAAAATETAMAIEDEQTPGDYHVCVRGNVHELGAAVPRGFLSAVEIEGDPVAEISAHASGRLEMAEWIADEENPLTARVIVNRVWHHLFGCGLVRTVDNFGVMGERPSHPELLDYLAVRFMKNDWRVKPLIREIMLSRTWRLSADFRMRNSEFIDPENRLLSRQNLRRLDAEALYDSILSLAGTLDTSMGGPTVRDGTKSEYGYTFETGRRAVYLPVFRNQLHDLPAAFDFPDPNLSAGRRTVSTLATQSLYLMNSPFVVEQASRAARRLLAEENANGERILLLYERALGRPPTEQERRLAEDFLAEASDLNEDEQVKRWTQLCQTIIGCIDFRYVK